MGIAKWALGIAIVYVVGGVAVSFFSGEVVDLETRDPRGGAFHTSVWVVDLSGDVWVRATQPEAVWLTRLRENPEVYLVRDGVRTQRRALIVDGVQARIDEGMRAKYGQADQVFAWLRDPGESVVIRLDEVPAAERWSEAYP